MTILTSTLGALLFLAGLMQTIYVWIYHRFLTGTVSKPEPKAATDLTTSVILCLRGVDPGLNACLESLLNQNHRNYKLHLVFDNKDDPAHGIAVSFFRGKAIEPVLHVMDPENFNAGSLKCHALVTAIEASAGESDLVALIDADSVVDPDWLTDLTAPFASPEVAATTGNRWFEPTSPGPGSLVRMAWNAAAIVQMYIYNIAWGGSLAVRCNALRNSGLLEKWKTAFCEDTMTSSTLAAHGLNLVRVPTIIVENRESISLSDALRWVTRQLLTVRLYHSGWPFVLLHAHAVLLCSAGVVLACLLSLVAGNFFGAALLALAGGIFQLLNVFLIHVICHDNRLILSRRNAGTGTQQGSGKYPSIFKLLPAILISQFLQPVAAFKAAIANEVDWRGIRYLIGNGTARMARYRKFEQEQDTNSIS